MLFDKERLSPEARRQIEALMRAKNMTLDQAINKVVEDAVGEGALSAVGRVKAKILQLVSPKRASARDSSG